MAPDSTRVKEVVGYGNKLCNNVKYFSMTRDEAMEIMHSWVRSPGLRKHMQAVAAAMAWYASQTGQDADQWWIAGLLHDMDYEKYPVVGPQGHPHQAVAFLREKGVNGEILDAILGHASQVPRHTRMAQTLFAVDELCGFIVAVALIKPNKKMSDVDSASVMKRLKEKRFAANVSREDIYQGAEELGVSLEEHAAHVIAALQADADQLGL